MPAQIKVIPGLQRELTANAAAMRQSTERTQLSDATLMSQIAAGDVEAFECLYQRYTARLVVVAAAQITRVEDRRPLGVQLRDERVTDAAAVYALKRRCDREIGGSGVAENM